MRNTSLISILCIFFVYNFLNSSNKISIAPISLNNHLPSYSVPRIIQDKNGFMWFGTRDGLSRYDGYKIVTFRSDLNKPNMLVNNEITCIAEDNNNHLWIGTPKGMNILDTKTYQIKVLDAPEIKNTEIKCITVTSDGCIWVGTNKQILRYNPDFSLRKKYDSSLPIGATNQIYEDNDGNIWITIWNCGLHKYNIEKDTFMKFPDIGSLNNPFTIFQDNKNQHWIGTWGDGLFLFNPEKNDKYTFVPVSKKMQGFHENRFFSIVQDNKYGYIWVMSSTGIHTLEYASGNNLSEVDISYLFSESNNIFSQIIKDRNGNLWIGTFSEGVLTINFNKPVIENYPIPFIKKSTGITPNITTMVEDNMGNIWLNQNRRGLYVYTPKKEELIHYQSISDLKNISVLNVVNCLGYFKTYPHEVWIGPESESKIYIAKKDGESIQLLRQIDLSYYDKNPGFPRILFEDNKGNIWIATTTALFFKPYNKDNLEVISHSFGNVTGITEDIRGSIWISTKDAGIFQLNMTGGGKPGLPQIIHYNNRKFLSKNIECICADLNGKIWIGTKEGSIVIYDIIKQEFEDYTKALKIYGESILNIIVDNFGHIWVSTNKRITEYNPLNGACRNYTQEDGVLVNSFLEKSCFKGNSGNIYFGGNRGISSFKSSERLSDKPKATNTYITDIKINNQSVFHNNENNKFDITNQTLTFTPDDKNIEISFSSLDYTFSSKIQYAYKMEGVDDDWIYTENDRQFAFYNQLPKGSYKFHVKSTDENGLWSDKITILKIDKQPAFYETWWAYSVYAIIVFISSYYAYRRTKNEISLRNELKIAQIEKEKSEDLTQTKLRYFTNISHDFLTPLTIISCVMDDMEITYNEEKKTADFKTMRANLNRLKRLLQQVLDFRKMESGNMKLHLSYGDIVVFLKDMCYNNILPLMKKKNINFSFLAEPPHIQAYFDADKINKIVFNLLSNAYKYTPKDGNVTIQINQYYKENSPYLKLEVIDTGIGIAKEDLKNIFTRFYTNRMGGGGDTNGIGLSLAKDLLELHHGTIIVESEQDKGTTFMVDIPIGKKSYSESELGKINESVLYEKDIDLMVADQTETKNQTTKPVDRTNINENVLTNVLLVEDNEELLVLMKNILSRHYRILTATNGVEGLEIVRKNGIDIIISDVMMPEMDGLTFCKILKQDLETSHIPIILLTAKSSTEDRIECYNAGADGYISKPFEPKVLEARINNFIVNKKDKQQEFKKDVEINISTLEYPTIDEQFLNHAIKKIEEQLSEAEFDVNTFAESLNISKSSLYRKLKTMTGLSPNEFIRNIRLKHACQMLKDQSISISEVAYSVGFSDPKYFTLCFKNEFNVTPSEYQKSISQA